MHATGVLLAAGATDVMHLALFDGRPVVSDARRGAELAVAVEVAVQRALVGCCDRHVLAAHQCFGDREIGFVDLQIRRAVVAFAECGGQRSEEHTSELQSLMRISYAVFCLKKKKNNRESTTNN